MVKAAVDDHFGRKVEHSEELNHFLVVVEGLDLVCNRFNITRMMWLYKALEALGIYRLVYRDPQVHPFYAFLLPDQLE